MSDVMNAGVNVNPNTPVAGEHADATNGKAKKEKQSHPEVKEYVFKDEESARKYMAEVANGRKYHPYKITIDLNKLELVAGDKDTIEFVAFDFSPVLAAGRVAEYLSNGDAIQITNLDGAGKRGAPVQITAEKVMAKVNEFTPEERQKLLDVLLANAPKPAESAVTPPAPNPKAQGKANAKAK